MKIEHDRIRPDAKLAKLLMDYLYKNKHQVDQSYPYPRGIAIGISVAEILDYYFNLDKHDQYEVTMGAWVAFNSSFRRIVGSIDNFNRKNNNIGASMRAGVIETIESSFADFIKELKENEIFLGES